MNVRSAIGGAVLTATLAGSLAGMATLAGASVATAATPSLAPAGVVTAQAKPGSSYTAFGNRTPWRAVVDAGKLTTEGQGVGERTVKVTRSAHAKGVTFSGRYQKTPVVLSIRNGRCLNDTLTDTGMIATLTVGKRSYTGCAVPGALEQADT